ncbi:MAG TPA: helix-turn-helix transcriptional regulator [Ideonella sp.]|uniref:helix-turn-helix domain-containing protein n=1 Tax=Ideonella sp. TaxID=1929293 RepID=UPI002B6FA416|nr:helix-turn-helix transcriptional regulator [Ideonella sp.]HSI50685.1 helix-turn-helix transcriptional regulator [Ideonella sp.]
MGVSNTSDFGAAVLFARKAVGLTQEDFDEVSSRVYVSALERKIKKPTLPKVDALAGRMGLHPLTVLALAYCVHPGDQGEVEELLAMVQQQLLALTER